MSDVVSSGVLSDEGTDETPPASRLVGVAMDGAVAVLTMQAAPYNLLNGEMTEAIIGALGWAQERHARAVILRSSLRHFSAGADLDL